MSFHNTTTVAVETFSSPSGSFFDSLKVFFLPEEVRHAIFRMVDVVIDRRGRGPNHFDFQSLCNEDSQYFVQECSDFLETLIQNNIAINIFEATKVVEEVYQRGKIVFSNKTSESKTWITKEIGTVVEKPRFHIDESVETIGTIGTSSKSTHHINHTKYINILTFLNKNGFHHYEALASMPGIRTDFSLIEIPGVTSSIRTLRISSNFHNYLNDIGIGIAYGPKSESLKKITFASSETSHQRYIENLRKQPLVRTSSSKKVTKQQSSQPSQPSQSSKTVRTSAFACLRDEFDDSDQEESDHEESIRESDHKSDHKSAHKSIVTQAPNLTPLTPSSGIDLAKLSVDTVDRIATVDTTDTVDTMATSAPAKSVKTWAEAVGTRSVGKNSAGTNLVGTSLVGTSLTGNSNMSISRSAEAESIIAALGDRMKINVKQSKQSKQQSKQTKQSKHSNQFKQKTVIGLDI